jgi:hypothetical protein
MHTFLLVNSHHHHDERGSRCFVTLLDLTVNPSQIVAPKLHNFLRHERFAIADMWWHSKCLEGEGQYGGEASGHHVTDMQ